MDTTKLLIFLVIFILLIMFLRAHVTIINTNPVNPVPVPVPVPAPVNKIGGCAGTRYGCCPNGITARQNAIGTNC
jgi:hypothetical protein